MPHSSCFACIITMSSRKLPFFFVVKVTTAATGAAQKLTPFSLSTNLQKHTNAYIYPHIRALAQTCVCPWTGTQCYLTCIVLFRSPSRSALGWISAICYPVVISSAQLSFLLLNLFSCPCCHSINPWLSVPLTSLFSSSRCVSREQTSYPPLPSSWARHPRALPVSLPWRINSKFSRQPTSFPIRLRVLLQPLVSIISRLCFHFRSYPHTQRRFPFFVTLTLPFRCLFLSSKKPQNPLSGTPSPMVTRQQGVSVQPALRRQSCYKN